MKRRFTVALLYSLPIGVAVACTVLAALSANVGQVSNNPATAQGQIGERLQAQFGNQATVNHDVEVYVQYQVRFMGVTGAGSLPFHKPCGKTFLQVGAENQAELGGTGSGSGGGGGGYQGSPWNGAGWFLGYTVTCTLGGAPISCSGYTDPV